MFILASHSAGCPAGQVMNFSSFMTKYPWALGLIMILLGPVVGLFGRRFFPWVISGIVAMTLLLAGLIITSILGFMDTTVGLAISVAVSIILGGLAGLLVMKTVWIAVGVLGLVGGFFIGSMIYSIFLAISGFGTWWAALLFSFIGAIIGGFLSFRFSKQVVLVMTSVIGAYAFMRGLSYFIGGYPSEVVIIEALKNAQPIPGLTQTFWIYLALFVTGTIGCMIYQTRNAQVHSMLTQDKNYVESDDNFNAVVNKIKNKGS